jgi:effector-binding domain-containing protein
VAVETTPARDVGEAQLEVLRGGAVREYYLDDPREVDAAKVRTEVLLPVS